MIMDDAELVLEQGEMDFLGPLISRGRMNVSSSMIQWSRRQARDWRRRDDRMRCRARAGHEKWTSWGR